jgi:acyl carrier protein
MIPAVLLAVPAFPLTTNGKLDRAALLKLDGGRPELDAFCAPQSEMERLIASLFQEVLEVDAVGLHDNFFDLGANSLLLVQVHRRLRERLKRDIPVVRLFQHPTVATLAQELADRPSAAEHEAAERLERGARRRAAREKRNSRYPERVWRSVLDSGE